MGVGGGLTWGRGPGGGGGGGGGGAATKQCPETTAEGGEGSGARGWESVCVCVGGGWGG